LLTTSHSNISASVLWTFTSSLLFLPHFDNRFLFLNPQQAELDSRNTSYKKPSFSNMSQMKAIACTERGDIETLKAVTVPKPSDPEGYDILVE